MSKVAEFHYGICGPASDMANVVGDMVMSTAGQTMYSMEHQHFTTLKLKLMKRMGLIVLRVGMQNKGEYHTLLLCLPLAATYNMHGAHLSIPSEPLVVGTVMFLVKCENIDGRLLGLWLV